MSCGVVQSDADTTHALDHEPYVHSLVLGQDNKTLQKTRDEREGGRREEGDGKEGGGGGGGGADYRRNNREWLPIAD